MHHSQVEVPGLSTESSWHQHCLCVASGAAGEVLEDSARCLEQLHTGAIGEGLDHNMGLKLLQTRRQQQQASVLKLEEYVVSVNTWACPW